MPWSPIPINCPSICVRPSAHPPRGTPGPVHLDLEGHAGQAVVDQEADIEVIIEETFTQVPPFRPEAELEKVTAALQLLNRAKRPVIVAGGGVTASGAKAELFALAEKLSIPVATSLNAKAMFPADHPLAVGVPGLYSRACANQVLCEADLVFFVGSHTGGQVTYEYQIPPPGTPIIQLDINPEELGRNYPIQVGMHGDVRNSLRRMLVQAETVPARTEWTVGYKSWSRAGKRAFATWLTRRSSPCGQNASARN